MNWLERNDDFLDKALQWLRLVLERQAAAGARRSEPRNQRTFFRRGNGERTSWRRVSAARLAKAAESMARAEDGTPPPALRILADRFGLTAFESRVLLLTAAMELDTGVARLCASVQGDAGRPYPTFALAFSIFDEAAWDALAPERPLRYWRLVEIGGSSEQPLTMRALRADERVVNFLKGLNHLDDRLTAQLVPFDDHRDGSELPPSQLRAVASITRHMSNGAGGSRPPVIQLLGVDGSSKGLAASRAASELGLQLFRLPAVQLPAESAELESLARLCQRESLLMPLALYLDAADPEDGSVQDRSLVLQRFVARCGTPVFLDTRDLHPGLQPTTLSLDVTKPTPSEQEKAWREALDSDAQGSARALAGQFNLNLATIRRIARRTGPPTAANGHHGSADSVHAGLWDACLMETRPRLDLLAQRIEVKATWNDIVLPAPERRQLQLIADQVGERSRVYDDWGFRKRMNRGLGITALFCGDSGTGKTMAAEVIANHLRLNLYRIDLSGVVSKYIGETEKNLRRLFDAAEDGGALLFFDEADALFGKRSEVKDSHDRYANIEVNYLLQRMEAYRGIAILATNRRSALDAAFVRRLRFIVDFPFPNVEDRTAIWRLAFPAEVPTAELDWDRLARLDLTGGSIHNIALNAAFRAAHENAQVTMPILLGVAKAEFRKMERPINEADFRWLEPQGAVA